ncbi:MAG TPA: hypothetical protein VE135_22800 [Pyrinomonadaceae bacterium]|nr:hypothetical protein [Pyrinomonadaceae bacterium]
MNSVKILSLALASSIVVTLLGGRVTGQKQKEKQASLITNGVPFQPSQKKVTAKNSSRRPEVYVEQGGCPFECCTYREWWAAESTPVLASPSAGAAQVRMLKKGEHVKAITGFVRTRAAEFIVTRNKGRYHAGDTIWVYSYHGEGFFLVWFKGRMSEEDLGFSPYGGSSGTRCQDDSKNCWGHLKAEHSSEWWIKLRLRDGRIGWTNRGHDYKNSDACG